MSTTIALRVNGQDERHDVEPNQTLLAFLRDTLDLTGAKEGCNEGECGACMVLVDGKAVNSCLMLAVEADGREITTIEGIGDAAHLHPLQAAFLKHSAVQCGFCTPGMIMTAIGLLAENPDPDEAAVREAMAGSLCRCTGYRQILDAIHEAARVMRGVPEVEFGTRGPAGPSGVAPGLMVPGSVEAASGVKVLGAPEVAP